MPKLNFYIFVKLHQNLFRFSGYVTFYFRHKFVILGDSFKYKNVMY